MIMIFNYFLCYTGTDVWVSQAHNICYGAKDNSFGAFSINQYGIVIGLKLEHSSGKVTCRMNDASFWSYWGCNGNSYYAEPNLNTIITDVNNKIVYPKEPTWVYVGSRWYKLHGQNGSMNALTFDSSHKPEFYRSGEEFRIWYGEDVTNTNEGNNGGTHCVNVYARFK